MVPETPEDANRAGLEAACEDSGGPKTGAGARTGTDAPENGDQRGACGSPCPPSWAATHAPPRQRVGAVPARDLGQRARAGEGASVLSGRWNMASLSRWQLRDRCPEFSGHYLVFCIR